ncbi:hypothetical protein CRE_06572 [Caenorhabditis remanei]|uniref:C-type lectin domain-containing protein n=1 Tax=Caenorhabditis remanei TaxID=31234 RepID=E3M1L6_CAERE|nr:hypothetical protein CRE_06572 [Caenorhabditis remanei]
MTRISSISLLLFCLSITVYAGYYGDSSEEYNSRRGHRHHDSYGGRRYDDENYPPRPPPKPRCDEGWKFFQRPNGGWCMKGFPGTLDQYSSEAQCVSQGAVLSGLQNVAEINYVVCEPPGPSFQSSPKKNSASALAVISPQVSGGVWIGAKRRAECIGSGQTAMCTKTNTFYWTDNSATGIDGMIFQQNEPNNGNNPRGNQNCALLTVAHTPAIRAVSVYWSGQMDDITCSTSASSYWPSGTLPRANRAYVCGKRAN